MENMLKRTLEVLLKKHYKSNCIYKILNAESEVATKKGDNYTSALKRVTMDVLLNSGKQTRKSVIIKEEIQDKFSRQMFNNMGLFPKEITVYRDILPHLEDIMTEHGDRTDPIWGKCLDYRPYDMIVLEDLSKYGYIMVDRCKGLDMEHSKLVVRGLAKFHATSAILKQKALLNTDTFMEHIYAKEKTALIKLQSECFEMLVNQMEKKWGPEWRKITEKIREEIAPNICSLIKHLTLVDNKKFNALCHGDFWVNNVLIKYGLDGVTPISLKFIDFQQSYYNSPAFDLKHFLATSISMDVRKHGENSLIQLYYEALMKELELFKYDGPAFTLNGFYDEMKRLDLYGLTIQLIVLPVILIENIAEIPDVEKMMKNFSEEKEYSFTFNPYKYVTPVFIDLIKDTVKTYAHNHLL